MQSAFYRKKFLKRCMCYVNVYIYIYKLRKFFLKRAQEFDNLL